MNRTMRKLHRSLGIAIAFFVLLFSITGILLNHTTDLKLDQRYLTWNWILAHYGIADIQPDNVYLLEQKVISQFGQQIFVDSTPVMQEQLDLLGGINLGDMMVMATRDALILFTSEGEFVERMSNSVGVPPMIQNIGLFHGQPVIQTREGLWRSDFMLEEWEKLSLDGVSWSVPQPMPDVVTDSLMTYFYGKGITYERLILDIHNGRILGDIGVWIIDLLAILMMILSLSGVVIWSKKRA